MKLLITDNEPGQRAALRSLLQHYCPEITEIEEAGGVQSGLVTIRSFRPDILLLDVEMDDGSGFDLLNQLYNPGFQLIFITAYNQYAIEAFKFSAIDYLLKPVDPEALQKSIQKAMLNIRNSDLQQQVQVLLQQLSGVQNRERKIVLKDIDNTWFVKVADVLYCQAEGTYTRFHLQNGGPILVSKNLKEYEEILEPLGFLRTHHSFLANPDKIKSFDKTHGGALVLEGGLSIPVSQRKKDFVMQVLEKR
ncbi:MAG TPA: LytTR family DNA-binding domain-containing protein [Ferruginibacter sp.]|nr:DNA-binding response regulator [Chitinophagaceae bacterium]HRI23334.1 LytTR family DNA-binding domain-containing protein [Ferruginibacter sp.]